MRPKTLWIKDEYLQPILVGREAVGVSVGYSNIQRLQVGDRLGRCWPLGGWRGQIGRRSAGGAGTTCKS